uniref:Ig-like domain-containing protein n=1 Tax=Lepisosteus oculatus TaxID=7918 RepID=W5N7A9_LEPOC
SVHQSPPNLLEKSGGSSVFQCLNHDKNYVYMYWYQQKGGKGALKLIGHLYRKNLRPEEEFRDQFTISGDATLNGTLEVSNITAADSAVYFCAVSQHSAANHLFPLQKPLLKQMSPIQPSPSQQH